MPGPYDYSDPSVLTRAEYSAGFLGEPAATEIRATIAEIRRLRGKVAELEAAELAAVGSFVAVGFNDISAARLDGAKAMQEAAAQEAAVLRMELGRSTDIREIQDDIARSIRALDPAAIVAAKETAK